MVPSKSPSVVTYIASCADTADISSFDCTPPSGSTFPLGMTTVTYVGRRVGQHELLQLHGFGGKHHRARPILMRNARRRGTPHTATS